MSHFTVLVVTDHPNDVEAALQPFHEFECTGDNDQYVQDIDKTDEIRHDYETNTVTRLRAPDGTLHKAFDDKFYRDPTPEEQKEIGPMGGTGVAKGLCFSSRDWGDGQGYRAKVKFIPEGYEEIEVPRREIETLAEYADDYHGKNIVPFNEMPDLEGKHQYGYTLIDEAGNVIKIIDRTNPNAKWDWWVVGGRWSGMLKAKPGAEAEKGRPGLMDSQYNPEGVDVFILADDGFEKWDLLSKSAGKAETALRSAWESAKKPGAFSSFIDACLEEGNEDASILRQAGRLGYGFFGIDPGKTMQEEIDECSPLSTFAVLMDSQWYERGEMGWWGAVSSDKGEYWEKEFAKLFATLPDDKWLTVVDCHI